MININLLPWRAQQQKRQQHFFIATLGASLLCTVLICCLLHGYLAKKLATQLQAHAYLQEESALLDQKITQLTVLKKQNQLLIQQQAIIKKLQYNRLSFIIFLSQLSKILPQDIYLLSIKKESTHFILEGRASSNLAISSFMQKMETSALFLHPVLTEMQAPYSSATEQENYLNRLYPFHFSIALEITSLKPEKSS